MQTSVKIKITHKTSNHLVRLLCFKELLYCDRSRFLIIKYRENEDIHNAVHKRQSQCVLCFGETEGALSKMHL